jgi:hypothetical protein
MNEKGPERALERLLLALERDVTEATDEEVMSAARELGMNPAMKGSAAFFGVTVPAWFQPLPRTTTRRKRPHVARRRQPKDDAPPST